MKKFFMNKKFFILCLSLIIVLCVGFSIHGITGNRVFAAEEKVRMVEGASVRTEDPNGIRFSARFSKDLFEGNLLKTGYQAGIVLIKASALGSGELLVDSVGSTVADAKVWVIAADNEQFNKMNAVIKNIPINDYGTAITARAFFKDSNGVYTYSQNTITRCVANVASIALASGETSDVLGNYVDNVTPTISLPDGVDANGNLVLAKNEKAAFSVSPSYLSPAISFTDKTVVGVSDNDIVGLEAGTSDIVIAVSSVSKTIHLTVIDLTDVSSYITNGQYVKIDNSIVAKAKSLGYNYLKATFTPANGAWAAIFYSPLVSNTEDNSTMGKYMETYADMSPSTVIIDFVNITANTGYTLLAKTNQYSASVTNAEFIKQNADGDVNYANAAYIYNDNDNDNGYFANNNGSFIMRWAQGDYAFAQPYLGKNVGKTQDYSSDVVACGASYVSGLSWAPLTGGYINKSIVINAKNAGYTKMVVSVVMKDVANLYYWNTITSAHTNEVNMNTSGSKITTTQSLQCETVTISIADFDYANWGSNWDWVCLPFIDSGKYMVTDIHFESDPINCKLNYNGAETSSINIFLGDCVDLSRFTVSDSPVGASVIWALDGVPTMLISKYLTGGTHALSAIISDGLSKQTLSCSINVPLDADVVEMTTSLVGNFFNYFEVDAGTDYNISNKNVSIGGDLYIKNDMVAKAKNIGLNYLELTVGGNGCWLGIPTKPVANEINYDLYSDMAPSTLVIDLSAITERTGKTKIASRNDKFLYVYNVRFVSSSVTERVDFSNPSYTYNETVFNTVFANNNRQFIYRWAQNGYAFAQPYLGVNVGKTDGLSSDVGGIGYTANGLTGGYISKEIVKNALSAGYTKLSVSAVCSGVDKLYYWSSAQENEVGIQTNGSFVDTDDTFDVVTISVDLSNFNYDSWSWNWVACVPYITQGSVFLFDVSFYTEADKIIAEGATKFQIVVSDSPTDGEMNAANVLSDNFYTATGVRIPITYESGSSLSPSSYAFSIGNTNLLKALYKADSLFTTESDDEYALRTYRNIIFFAGKNDSGVNYAVNNYLEDYLGVKVLASDYTYVPTTNEVAFTSVSKNDAPDIEVRSYMTATGDVNVNYANGLDSLFFEDTVKWADVNDFNNIHNTLLYVPLGEYYTSANKNANYHMYSRSSETNIPDSPVDICFSDGVKRDGTKDDSLSQSALTVTIAKLKQLVLADPDAEFFGITQMDVDGKCNCDECKNRRSAYGGDLGVVIRFCNLVADEIQQWSNDTQGGRKINIITLSYLWTDIPPVTKNGSVYATIDETVSLRDNVYLYFAPINAYPYFSLNDSRQPNNYVDFEAKWSVYKSKLFIWQYDCNFDNPFLYYPTIQSVKQNFTIFKNLDVKYIQVQDIHTMSGNWIANMKRYIEGRLMWDLSLDPYTLRSEYVRYYFGDSGYSKALGFLEAIESRFSDFISEKDNYFGIFNKAISSTTVWTDRLLTDLMSYIVGARNDTSNSSLSDKEKEIYLSHLDQLKITVLYLQLINRSALGYDSEKVHNIATEFFAIYDKNGICNTGIDNDIAALRQELIG